MSRVIFPLCLPTQSRGQALENRPFERCAIATQQAACLQARYGIEQLARALVKCKRYKTQLDAAHPPSGQSVHPIAVEAQTSPGCRPRCAVIVLTLEESVHHLTQVLVRRLIAFLGGNNIIEVH